MLREPNMIMAGCGPRSHTIVQPWCNESSFREAAQIMSLLFESSIALGNN